MKPGDLVEPDWSFRIHAKPGNDSFERQLGLVLSYPEVKDHGTTCVRVIGLATRWKNIILSII